MHATGKYLKGSMGPAISKGSFKSAKIVYHLTCLAMESLKIFVLFPLPISIAYLIGQSLMKILSQIPAL